MINRDELLAGLPSLEGLEGSQGAVVVLVLIERGLTAIGSENREPDDREGMNLAYALAAMPVLGPRTAASYALRAFDRNQTASMSPTVPLPNTPEPTLKALLARVHELKAAYQSP